MTATAAVVARRAPADVAAIADALVGAALIMAVPVVLLVVIYWRSLPQPGGCAPASDSIAAVGLPQEGIG